MGLLEGIAQYLQARQLGAFDPSGVVAAGAVWPVFMEFVPPAPDQVVALTISGGVESDSLLAYDEPIVQVRVRGTQDPRTSRTQASAIRNALHGLSDRSLPDGTYLVLAVAIQAAPQSIGMDDKNRHEHVFDLRCEVSNVTDNRQ